MVNNMIYLIVGRSGSGKDYLANLLAKQGMNLVKSYTTRPPRYEGEDSHIFVSVEDAAKITDKVAITHINGYEYFATKSQVEASDAYIIDPNGLDVLTKNMPDTTFNIVYVESDYMTRKLHAIKRADDKIKEEKIFEARDADENDQFSAFEDKLQSLIDHKDLPFTSNITRIYKYVNDYNENSAKDYAEYLIQLKKKHDKFTDIVTECINLELIHSKDNKCMVINNDGSSYYTTIEHFADTVLGDDKGVSALMQTYVMHSDKFATPTELEERKQYLIIRTCDRDSIKIGQARTLSDAQTIMKNNFIKFFKEKYGDCDEIGFADAYEPLAGKKHELNEYSAWINDIHGKNFDWAIFDFE